MPYQRIARDKTRERVERDQRETREKLERNQRETRERDKRETREIWSYGGWPIIV